MSWSWVVWWIGIFVSFGLLEGYAWKHPDRQNTLSRTMALLGARFPLSIGLIMFGVGILCGHFWWPQCLQP